MSKKHDVKLFLINNPYKRNADDVSMMLGCHISTVQKALKELNIQQRFKPLYYVG